VRTGDNGPEIKCPLFRRHFDEAWVNYQIAEIGVRHRPRFAEKGRKKICVLNTGGTIGMFRQPDGTVGPPKTEEEFIERYRQIEDLADITFIPLFGLDSVNIYPPEWAEIARAIFDRRDAGYEGFVVAHGTDTMAFTASAVAFALGPNLRFPVVFTGAQTTADVPHGDAASNLYRACMTALEPIPEVVIAFAEYVFRAVRAQKKNEERFDAFESPNYPALAYIGETIDLRRDFVRQLPPTLQPIELRASFQEGAVLMLNQYPGLDPKFFLYILKLESEGKGPRCRGIVVQTQGAGNVSSRLPFSYVRVLEEAQRMGIPVLIASQFPTKRGTDVRFQTASWALKLDAIPVGHMTVAAAITKFHWVLGQLADATPRRGPEAAAHIEEVRRMMHRNYVGEIDIEEERR
jgi:L-asparaginase